MTEDVTFWNDAFKMAVKRAEQAEAERDALRKDAERYRRLIATGHTQSRSLHMDGSKEFSFRWNGPRAQSFTESIDVLAAAPKDSK